MANPLEMGGPPQPPEALQQPQQQGSAPLQAAPPQAPAPTHQQTVAALRHFGAIKTELEGLLKDQALGKSSIKSSIIDSTTKLVAERIISPAQAVMQLGHVPDNPIEQRKWITTMMEQTAQAANAVLDHHAAGQNGTTDWAQEAGSDPYHPDDHMKHMGALTSMYGGTK